MIVPEYWAEAKLKAPIKGRPVTIKRFGWSDESQVDAQKHAEQRAREAIERIKAGEPLRQFDHKIPYNGAEGLPIREEVINRFGDTVITRNGYGALCLNTPDILFADIDLREDHTLRKHVTRAAFAVLVAVAAYAAFDVTSWLAFFAGIALSSMFASLLGRLTEALLASRLQTPEERAVSRMKRFADEHPRWHLRLYKTPAGFRVLVMHRTFDPTAKETLEFLEQMQSDPIYVQMCRNQRCFRARVSAKPWRIGIPDHLRPRPGTWPINIERMPDRMKWVRRYENLAKGFSACHFVERLGSNHVDPKAETVRKIHDEYCRIPATLPMA